LSSLDSFSVQSEQNGGSVRLMPTGELDIATIIDVTGTRGQLPPIED